MRTPALVFICRNAEDWYQRCGKTAASFFFYRHENITSLKTINIKVITDRNLFLTNHTDHPALLTQGPEEQP
jgi:hypothetical protein